MQLCVSCNHLHTTISQPSHTWGAEGGETDQAVWGGVGLEDGALDITLCYSHPAMIGRVQRQVNWCERRAGQLPLLPVP